MTIISKSYAKKVSLSIPLVLREPSVCELHPTLLLHAHDCGQVAWPTCTFHNLGWSIQQFSLSQVHCGPVFETRYTCTTNKGVIQLYVNSRLLGSSNYV